MNGRRIRTTPSERSMREGRTSLVHMERFGSAAGRLRTAPPLSSLTITGAPLGISLPTEVTMEPRFRITRSIVTRSAIGGT
jgi:hypothetical protein